MTPEQARAAANTTASVLAAVPPSAVQGVTVDTPYGGVQATTLISGAKMYNSFTGNPALGAAPAASAPAAAPQRPPPSPSFSAASPSGAFIQAQPLSQPQPQFQQNAPFVPNANAPPALSVTSVTGARAQPANPAVQTPAASPFDVYMSAHPEMAPPGLTYTSAAAAAAAADAGSLLPAIARGVTDASLTGAHGSAGYRGAGLTFGEQAIYRSPAFVSVFADHCYSDAAVAADLYPGAGPAEGTGAGARAPVTRAKPTNERLLTSLELFRLTAEAVVARNPESVTSVCPASDLGVLRAVSDALAHAKVIAGRVPGASEDPQKLVDAISVITARVHSVTEGEMVIVPGGWLSKDKDDLQSVIYCVFKRKGAFVFAVVSTNAGLEYHPVRVQHNLNKNTEHKAPSTQYQLALLFDNVNAAKLQDTAFWLFLLRMQVFPDDANTAKMLYEVILPFLNDTPLQATINVNCIVPLSTDTDAASIQRACAPQLPYATATDKEPLWGPRAVGGDPSGALALMASCKLLMWLYGLTAPRVEHLAMCLKWQMMRLVETDLLSSGSLRAGERLAVSHAAKQLASTAAFCAQMDNAVTSTAQLREVFALTVAIERAAAALPLDSINQPCAPPAVAFQGECPAQAHNVSQDGLITFSPLPGFESLRRDDSVEGLAGPAAIPPMFRPIEFTLVPDPVTNYTDVRNALRYCDQMCTLMMYQGTVIKNTYPLRAAFIQHVFTNVIPVPLPHDSKHKDKCLWSKPMRYETQIDILHSLRQVSRHFAACSLSLKATRSFDAARILVMSVIATMADNVVRTVACDVPSLFSLHMAGRSPPNPRFHLLPFGIDMGHFAEQSETMIFTQPELALCRTKVLDYFFAQRKMIRDDHFIMAFERTMELGNMQQLMEQLAWDIGFNADKKRLPLYFTGEDPEVMSLFKELGYFRDIIFMFKYLMNPTSEHLPDLRAWTHNDATLAWSWRPEHERKPKENGKKVQVAAQKHMIRGRYNVAGFRLKRLRCFDPKKVKVEGEETDDDDSDSEDGNGKNLDIKTGADADAAQQEKDQNKANAKSDKIATANKGFFSRIKRIFTTFKPKSDSGADPSLYCNAEIDDEEDVLHVSKLPDFGGRLRQRESELLASYLTVPYMRIPLILQFFATPERILALGAPELRELLDYVLFEPDLWQNAYATYIPKVVPAPNRTHLGTPCGLLFNELQKAPHGIVKCITSLLTLALELDTGKYSPRSSAILLYVVRLCVRVDGFMTYIIKHNEWRRAADAADAEIKAAARAAKAEVERVEAERKAECARTGKKYRAPRVTDSSYRQLSKSYLSSNIAAHIYSRSDRSTDDYTEYIVSGDRSIDKLRLRCQSRSKYEAYVRGLDSSDHQVRSNQRCLPHKYNSYRLCSQGESILSIVKLLTCIDSSSPFFVHIIGYVDEGEAPRDAPDAH